MAKIILSLLLFVCANAFGQNVISSVNAGAVSANNLVFSVGEIFVMPSTPAQANSGLVGALSRISFLQTGIEHTTPSIRLNVFPNPTQGPLYLSNTDNNLFRQVFVYNGNGQLVAQYAAAPKFIDLSGFANGVYSVHTENLSIHPLKIVKQ